MSNEKLIEDWNEMFTSFRISTHDLEHPTEAFLTNALVNILNSINIDVSRFFCDADAENKRSAKIKFFQYINYLYRNITKKKFLFFDLINPTPKKTLNLLQTLLNYVLYYNMVKDEVVSATKPAMAKLRELEEMKQRYVKENQQNKNLTKQMQVAVESYSNEVASVTKQVDELQNMPVLSQYEKNQEQLAALKMMKGQLTVENTDLAAQCIEEDQYKKMKSSVFEAQEILSEINEASEKLSEDQKSLTDDFASMEKRISVLQDLNDLVSEGKLVKASDIIDLQEELEQQSGIIEENEKTIEAYAAELDKYQSILREAQGERDVANAALNRHLGPVLSAFDEKKEEVAYWGECVDETSSQLEEAEDNLDLICQNSEAVLQLLGKLELED